MKYQLPHKILLGTIHYTHCIFFVQTGMCAKMYLANFPTILQGKHWQNLFLEKIWLSSCAYMYMLQQCPLLAQLAFCTLILNYVHYYSVCLQIWRSWSGVPFVWQGLDSEWRGQLNVVLMSFETCIHIRADLVSTCSCSLPVLRLVCQLVMCSPSCIIYR